MKKSLILFLSTALLLSGCKNYKSISTSDKEDNKAENVTQKEQPKESKHAELVNYKIDSESVTPVYPEYKEWTPVANAKPYEIKDDLSNVELVDSNDYIMSHQTYKDELKKNGFFIEYATMQQPFAIYESNQYTFSNSIVTTDSMLHLFHVMYLGILEELETTKLRDNIIDLSKTLYKESADNYADLDGENKELAKKNAALFYTGLRLLDSTSDIHADEEIKKISDKELDNIKNESVAESNITGQNVHYSQFKPRGNYDKSDELRSYFRVNMLYSQLGMTLKDLTGNFNESSIKQALLMTRNICKDEKNYQSWLNIYNPISFLVENSEDLTPFKFYEIIKESTNSLEISDLLKDDTIDRIKEKLNEINLPKIKPQDGITFAFLPQRAVIDNVWLQNMLDNNNPSKRPVASGLDVMAVLGNNLAEKLVTTNEKNLLWENFLDKYKETKELVNSMDEKEEKGNIYRAWLWTLKGYNHDFKEPFPKFMTNDKWKLKDLNSALGSWAQLKHDTILYAKQFGAEMGGYDEEKTHNFVEPNIDIYNRLLWLSDFTLENSQKFELLNENQKEQIFHYKDMLEFLISVSEKELNDEEITADENDRITTIAGEMENIFLAFNKDKNDEFSIRPSEKDMTNVADLQKSGPNTVGIPENKFLEVGSGRFSIMHAIFRHNGKYYIGCGPVMNYYEFLSDERLTDKEFSNMINGFDFETGKEINTEAVPFFKELYIK